MPARPQPSLAPPAKSSFLIFSARHYLPGLLVQELSGHRFRSCFLSYTEQRQLLSSH